MVGVYEYRIARNIGRNYIWQTAQKLKKFVIVSFYLQLSLTIVLKNCYMEFSLPVFLPNHQT